MPSTENLGLPFLEAGQAQKHVTLNEALRMLDALVQLSVGDVVAAPPETPENGERYLVAELASGGFAGKDNQVAVFEDGAWRFLVPQQGWLLFVASANELRVFDGEDWQPPHFDALQELSLLGIGTSADETNPFSAKLNKALWTARYDGEGGDGSLRYTLNKEAPGKVLSLLLQSNWSGRAEIGLIGDDNLSVKVSADGAGWKQAITIGRSDGRVGFPEGIVHPESGMRAALYIPAPVREIWRLDASRGATPRTYTISAVSGTTITLTTSAVAQIFHTNMRDSARVRIWNVSKSPAQAAWVDWNLSATQLRVTDAAHIAGWSNGETVRLGDPNPTGTNALEMVAVDIGSYLFNEFGTVFPQKGVMLGIACSSSNGPAGVSLSSNGASGSAFGGYALSNGKYNTLAVPIVTSVPSPISGSNLIFVSEVLNGASDLTVCYVRTLGVYG